LKFRVAGRLQDVKTRKKHWRRVEAMRIRKRFRVLFLAAAAATIVVPVGLSYTLEQNSSDGRAGRANTAVLTSSFRSVTVPASIDESAAIPAVPGVLIAPIEPFDLADVPDAAKLFLVGTLLVGAAAIVRKSG
jgi:hypothetical protein